MTATIFASVLETAAAIVERGWCQGAHARDEAGASVYVDAPAARSWCLQGAVAVAAAQHDLGRVLGIRPLGCDLGAWAPDRWPIALEDALRDHLGQEPSLWNDDDGRTAEEVVAVLREAAQRLVMATEPEKVPAMA